MAISERTAGIAASLTVALLASLAACTSGDASKQPCGSSFVLSGSPDEMLADPTNVRLMYETASKVAQLGRVCDVSTCARGDTLARATWERNFRAWATSYWPLGSDVSFMYYEQKPGLEARGVVFIALGANDEETFPYPHVVVAFQGSPRSLFSSTAYSSLLDNAYLGMAPGIKTLMLEYLAATGAAKLNVMVAGIGIGSQLSHMPVRYVITNLGMASKVASLVLYAYGPTQMDTYVVETFNPNTPNVVGVYYGSFITAVDGDPFYWYPDGSGGRDNCWGTCVRLTCNSLTRDGCTLGASPSYPGRHPLRHLLIGLYLNVGYTSSLPAYCL